MSFPVSFLVKTLVRRRALTACCWLLAALSLIGLNFGAESAPPSDAARSDVPALCEKAKGAYVFISGGSGVVVGADGLMLTNTHVVGNRREFDVRTGMGRHFRAKVLGRDSAGDLTVLRLQLADGERVPFLELGDSESLRIGDGTLAVGNPFALGLVDQSPTFTLGVVSALHQAQGGYTECIITDSKINPGNSGGPLINMAGQVVGINGQISTRWGLRSNTGLGYAISARQIALWLPRLAAADGGTVAHGRLAGLEFQTAARESPASLVVRDVGEGTPAATGGLAAGDAIVRWDGLSVANSYRLASVMGMYPADHEVEIAVRRGDQELPLTVKLVASRRAQIGFKVAAPGENDAHVKVAEIEKDSAAERAGLLAGDEIVSVAGTDLSQGVAVQHRFVEVWLRRGVFAYDIVRLKVLRKNEQGEPAEREVRIVVPGPS